MNNTMTLLEEVIFLREKVKQLERELIDLTPKHNIVYVQNTIDCIGRHYSQPEQSQNLSPDVLPPIIS